MNILINCTKTGGEIATRPLHHLADLNISDISTSLNESSHLLRCKFERCTFSGTINSLYTDRVQFINCTFYGVSFVSCDLIGAEFINCEFYNCTGSMSVTAQSGLEELFDLADPGVDDENQDPGPDMDYDSSYDSDRVIASGARYTTEF